MGTTGKAPPAYVVSRASKFGVFSSNPILSNMSASSWLVLTWAGGGLRWAGSGESSGSS